MWMQDGEEDKNTNTSQAGPMIKEAIERFEDDLPMDDSIMT